MDRAIFQWQPGTALWAGARLLPEGMAPGEGLAGTLCALREALRSGGEFTVSPDGAAVLPGGVPGYFRSRTSGTTGPAKSIRRSHASWIASFEVNRAHLGLSGADRYGILSGPAHSLALYALAEGAHLGAGLHCLSGSGPGQQARLLAEAGVSVLYCTPSQLRLLCRTGTPLPALRRILCGGGRLPPGLREDAANLWPGAPLHEFYGAAETSFIAWGEGGGPEGSAGRLYPGVELRIGPADADGCGEIWVRSPYLFEGYAEGGSPDTRWQDGFVTVGEMGRLGPDGFLTVAGRRSRMVSIAGQNVFPEDIEAFLLSDPAVAHCAVVPRKDARRGTVLVAVAAGREGDETGARLLRACRDRFGALAAPRRFFLHPDFPLTVSGKPDLAAIARWLDTR